MAAPMMSNNPLTKRTLRNLILCNFVIVLALICLAYIPFNGKSHFDLISNSLSATKLLSCFTLVFHVSLHMFLGTRSQKVKLSYWLKDLFRCFGIFFSSILSFHCLAVLFGAPFTQKTAETFHFAMMLSSAAVGPLLIHLETNVDAWIRVIACQSPEPGIETTAYLSCICSLVGAWLGAVPIPLDWDRPWQVWPITCVLGTLIGHCVGIVLSSVYMSLQFHKGKQFKIT